MFSYLCIVISFRCIIFTLIAMLMAACGTSAADRERLERAETIVREQPDSALAILDSIAPGSLSSNRFRAHATVARAEACYISGRPLPADSVFNATIAILSQRETDDVLMRAYFLNGYRKIADERYIDAIVDLLLAEEIAAKLGDVHFGGLAQRNIADAFDRMDDHASALAYYKKSAETFRADPDSSYYYWGLYNVARAYNNVFDYSTAIKLSDSITRLQTVRVNPTLYCASLRNLAIAKLNDNQSEAALELLKSMKQSYDFNALDYYNMGRAYLNLNMIPEAKACSDSVKAFDPTDTNLDFSIARYTYDKDRIFKLVDDNMDYTNSEFESIYKRNYVEVIDRFYRQALDYRTSQLRVSRLRFYIVLSVIGLLVIIVFISVYEINKRKEAKINATLSQVEELSETLSAQSQYIAKLQDEVAEGTTRQDDYKLEAKNQILAKLQAFNQICDVYSDHSDDSEHLSRRIKAFIAKNATKKNLEEIRRSVNKYLDDIISRFQADFPETKSDETDLFTLIVAGFKAPAIALYLKTTCGSIYARKTRLKQKIQKSNPEKTQQYLRFIDQSKD